MNVLCPHLLHVSLHLAFYSSFWLYNPRRWASVQEVAPGPDELAVHKIIKNSLDFEGSPEGFSIPMRQ